MPDKYHDGSHIGIFVKVPEEIAKYFLEQDQDPHITILQLGAVDDSVRQELTDFLETLCATIAPIFVKLNPRITYFEPSDHSDDDRVAKLEAISPDLKKLYDTLDAALNQYGFNVDHSFAEFKPHATVDYIDPNLAYTGLVPQGEWIIREIEIWGWEEPITVSLRDKMVETVTSAEMIQPLR